MADKETKLTNPSTLGLHLRAGAGDRMLTSALYVYDETRDQDVQETLDGKSDKGHEHTISDLTDFNPSDYGKLDDVKVDGESVVTDKVANITLPKVTPLSDEEILDICK